jgi:hypothetical protein
MPEHFTRNTVMASCWCVKCGKPTMHRVDGVKRGPCMVCMERAPETATTPQAAPVEQGSLFSDALVRDKRGD